MGNAVKDNPKKFILIPSLGQTRYLSFMKQAELVIGNSSSGILESPYLGIPTVNIGDRQKGRHRCSNIIQSEIEKESILNAFNEALSGNYNVKSDYWGDGNASSIIKNILKEVV